MEGCIRAMCLCDVFPPLYPPCCSSHASVLVTLCNSFFSQVPAPLDRRAGDLPDQSGRDRADVLQLRPAASLPHLLPAGERPASAGCRLPL